MRILYLQSLLESVWQQLYWFITHIPQDILSGCVVSDFSYSHYKPSSQFRVFLPLKSLHPYSLSRPHIPCLQTSARAFPARAAMLYAPRVCLCPVSTSAGFIRVDASAYSFSTAELIHCRVCHDLFISTDEYLAGFVWGFPDPSVGKQSVLLAPWNKYCREHLCTGSEWECCHFLLTYT